MDECLAGSYTNSGVMPYRLFVPANYDSTRRYPLVFLFNENQARHPCFLLAPQCPTNTRWTNSTPHTQLVGLLGMIMSQYSIDPSRVYVTGLSMGGGGTWDMLNRNSSLFAAGVPLSASFPSVSAAVLATVPIWAFHAANDATVPVTNTRSTIAAIRAAGGAAIYTEYHYGDHPIWTSSYASPLLVEWVMAQTKGVATNVAPRVAIAVPNAGSTYTTAARNLPLSGTIYDPSMGVSVVSWSNNRGGNGLAAGTSSWPISGVPLQPGVNLVTVLATGTAWIPAYGGATTFNQCLTVQQVGQPAMKLVLTSTGMQISWTGGAAPFHLEHCANLASPHWEEIWAGSTNSVTLQASPGNHLFCVRSQ